MDTDDRCIARVTLELVYRPEREGRMDGYFVVAAKAGGEPMERQVPETFGMFGTAEGAGGFAEGRAQALGGWLQGEARRHAVRMDAGTGGEEER